MLESLGFFDIFTPIRHEGKRIGTLLSGAFAQGEPSEALLRASWSELTGQDPSADNLEFRQFVRVMLETPVLEGPVLSAYRKAFELFASVMVGGGSASISKRLQELLTEVFSKHLPHSYWMDWALGLPTIQATPLWNLEVEKLDWVNTDMGIRRMPTTVLTVVPLGSEGKRRDPVGEMIRIYRFQRKAFQFARGLSETVGGKLENYGAVFVTSADSSLSRPQRKREILEKAEKIRNFAAKELGGPVLVGVGETVTPGDSLSESYRQAVLALHLQKEAGTSLVFFTSGRDEKNEGLAELTRLLLSLKKRFESGSFSNLEEILDGFLKQVLILSFQNPDEIRWHLHYGLLQIGEVVKQRADLNGNEMSRMVEKLIQSLEGAATTQELILVFKDGLEQLVKLAQDPGKGRGFYALDKVREHLEKHFRGPIKIAKLAKLAGVSASTLSRRFKKMNGIGWEAYLQNLRLTEARRLLKSGSLAVSQIAKDCGFKSDSYFIRLFRKKNKISPGEFRKKAQSILS
ncbi:MAG: helix-turn-helix domain-containing protein [bacterium]